MRKQRTARVVVVGAGPAGLATALALRQAEPDLAITVLRAAPERVRRPTETLPPTLEPLLRHLGVWEAFRTDGHRPSYGSSAAWGEACSRDNDFVFHPYARGWHVDRLRFDRTLLDRAVRQGVDVVDAPLAGPPARLDRGGWSLPCVSDASGPFAIEADWVVDASGRSAIVARRLGARFVRTDRSVAVARSFAFPGTTASHEGNADHRSYVEATESGWWSVGWAPDGTAWVAFMTDDDLAKSGNLRTLAAWDRLLRETRHVQDRLAGMEPRHDPVVHAAHSGFLNPVAGDRWLAVGDAASCLDPLSSMGVFKALRSGILASFALRNAFAGDDAGMTRYVALHRAEYARYLEGRERFYAEEGRWPRSEFWRRRRPTAESPEPPSMPSLASPVDSSWPSETPSGWRRTEANEADHRTEPALETA